MGINQFNLFSQELTGTGTDFLPKLLVCNEPLLGAEGGQQEYQTKIEPLHLSLGLDNKPFLLDIIPINTDILSFKLRISG